MHIKKQNLKEFQKIQRWNGKGTEDDPIIMDFKCISIENLRLKSIKTNLIIKNLKAMRVTLFKCYNIKIKNCDIQTLYIEFCSKIVVEENKIKQMEAPFSRDCIIRNNKFHAYFLDFEWTNNHAEQKMFEEYFINPFGFSLLFLISGIGLIIFGLININLSGEGFIYIGIVFLILSGFCVPLTVYEKQRISEMKNLPDNIYENNLPYN